MKTTTPQRFFQLAILAISLAAASGARSQTVIYSDDLKANETTRPIGSLFGGSAVQYVNSGLTGTSSIWRDWAPTYGWAYDTYQTAGVVQSGTVPFGDNSYGQGTLLIPTEAQGQLITLQITAVVSQSPTWLYYGNDIDSRLTNMLVGGWLDSSGNWGLVHGQWSYTGPFAAGSLAGFDNSVGHTLSFSLNPVTNEVQFSIDGSDVTGWIDSRITNATSPTAIAAGFVIQENGISTNVVSDFSMVGVPEPGTVGLLIGAAAFAVFRYRTRFSRLA